MRALLNPLAGLAIMFSVTGPSTALAADLISRDTISGVVEAGLGGAGGEASWLDRGLGKLRHGDGSSAAFGDAIVAWRPSSSDRWGALVSIQAQSDADPAVDVNEAYVLLRPDPSQAVRVSARAGLFFPPVSLEHDGSEWVLERTLSASAINSWVAEEVKTVGVEGKVRAAYAGRPVTLTAGAFQGNDTSGVLLTFRGWAIHDLRGGLSGDSPLPPLPAMFAGKQAPDTRNIDEVDGRWGGYGRLDVEPSPSLMISLFGYANNGDPTAIRNGQYAWDTRFVQAAARWRPRIGLEVLAQLMSGQTEMGRLEGGIRPASIGFDSGFVLVSQSVGKASASGRLEYFTVSDRTFKATDNNAEAGWAATGAWRQPVSPAAALVVEGVFTHSDRPDRRRFGEAPEQNQAQLRGALRYSF